MTYSNTTEIGEEAAESGCHKPIVLVKLASIEASEDESSEELMVMS